MLLGIDIGTTTVSGVCLDAETGAIRRTVTRPHGADVAGLPPTRHEQCPGTLVRTVLQVAEALGEGRPVSRLVLSGQMHGIVLVDRSLKPLTNLITWRDQRTADMPASVRHHAHAAETGCFLHPGYGGLTLHWLARSASIPPAAFRALTIQGFVQACLTGACTIDETSAAGLGLWDVRRNAWHAALVEELGIPKALLPEFVASCRACGQVREGCGALSGATVYSAVADNQAGVIGARASAEGRADEAVINVGTSGQISVPLRAYAYSPAMETRPMPGGAFIQVFATLCGGWAYQYLADFFRQVAVALTGREVGLTEAYEAMARMAESGGAEGVRVDPRFAGERSGDAKHTGLIYGITTDNLTPKNLVHAFAEGIANELAAPVDLVGVSGVVAVGNGVRMNPVLRRAIERRFGVPCRLAEAEEAAAYGAACAVLKMMDDGVQ